MTEYDQGWNDAIKAAAKACEDCGTMALAINGKDIASSDAFSAAIQTLIKTEQ